MSNDALVSGCANTYKEMHLRTRLTIPATCQDTSNTCDLYPARFTVLNPEFAYRGTSVRFWVS